MQRLPIDDVLPRVVAGAREARRVVLRAEPGAGKTTRVPPALLDADVAGGREVLVVEPRRIAARAAAAWIASERGGPLGREVGYRVRFESKGDARTRLWLVTEGVFARRLASDPLLERVGAVVLDEFHERHLDGDLALAVVRHLQDTVRPDLALVVMSATLDAGGVAAALPGAAVVEAAGRAHPVEVTFTGPAGERVDAATRVARAVPEALAADDGDVLVFLAGARDIRRAAEAIGPLCARRGVAVEMLHGAQPLGEQQRVLRRGSRRRIVLATNVAETALTVEGVTTVVDAGEARVARFDPRIGVNRLEVVPISRAAAAQRAGRAGRTGPGRCLRLWSAAEDAGRRERETPEIGRLDLARLVLAVRAWGMADVGALAWLDAPPAVGLARATALLRDLGALGDVGLTAIGRRMLGLPLEPRLARVAIEAERLGAGADGALLVALAGERDVVRRGPAAGASPLADAPSGPSDLVRRMELFGEARRARFSADRCRALGLDPGALRSVDRARRQIARRGAPADAASAEVLGRALLAGFPDRVARRRADGGPRAVMVGGTGVILAAESVVRDAPLFVCVDVEAAAGADSLVRIASAVEEAWLARLPDGVVEETATEWDAASERVVSRRRRRYRDVVLEERTRGDVDPQAAAAVLGRVVRADPLAAAALDEDGRRLLERLRFWRAAFDPEGTSPEPDVLLADAVAAAAAGCVGLAELRRKNLTAILLGLVPSDVRRRLGREAPAEWVLPSGRRVPVVYHPGRPPRLAARVQETFGLAATPLLGGRVPLVVELLAPNGRPVQVTDDLASFWRTTYAEVRRQLRGRYPKHDWPEDPATARPSAGPKRRR
jgi:ATP-dependent helicase HrpB